VLTVISHQLSTLAGLLSYGASGLHPIAGPAELIQNVRFYISTLIAVQQNIKVDPSHTEGKYADSK
jgi:hypothetical protein